MNRFSRRRMLRGLVKGGGGLVLGPLLSALDREARGEDIVQKRVVFLVGANGIHPQWNYVPPGIDPDHTPLEAAAGSFAWPKMLASLARHRARVTLLDGFANPVGDEHSAAYGALSCADSGRTVTSPGAATIDQILASALGKQSRFPSVLFGILPQAEEYGYSIFASAAGRAEPFVIKPDRLRTRLFGAGSDGERTRSKRSMLLGNLRYDIELARRLMSDSELQKLNRYLALVDDFDRRNKLDAPPGELGLPADDRPPTMDGGPDYEGDLSRMWDLATLALSLRLTNVIGVSAGAGHGHRSFVRYKGVLHAAGLPWSELYADGHQSRDKYAPGMDAIHDFHAGLVARLVDKLASIPEGTGTMMDNTIIVFMNDNGEAHHSRHQRWPVVVVGDAGGALKAPGRYLRFAPGTPLSDLFVTLAQAVGVPLETFGSVGGRPGRVLPALLA